jgi:hypothetical protein
MTQVVPQQPVPVPVQELSKPPAQLPIICHKCKTENNPTNYFCANCGGKIREKPVTVWRQVYIYTISILMPPLGLVWTFRYFRSKEQKLRIIAWVALILTIVSSAVNIIFFFDFLQTLFNEVNAINNMGL